MQICTFKKYNGMCLCIVLRIKQFQFMKKLLTLIFAFVAFVSVSNAQLGFRGGVNIANMTLESEELSLEPGSTLVFHVGLTYDKMINENLTFRPGLLYSAKGYNFELDGFDENIEGSYNYLEVPLDFVYKTGAINIHGGPYIGYLLSAELEGEDIKEESQTLDFGLNLGISYDITEQIGFGFNYGLGLANVFGDEGDEGNSAKHKVIGLFIAYKL